MATAKPPDLVVIMPVKDWVCARCTDTGDLLTMDDVGPLCMTCADLDHLIFLGAGDAALTRRAKKASVLSAVVVRWSRSRKRYERQGILVEEAALDQAEQECLADEDARSRRRERDRERRADEDVELQARMAAEITRLFPRCPSERAEAIARHTALRGSGRVGRSAAGRALDEQAITLAVVASVRVGNFVSYGDFSTEGDLGMSVMLHVTPSSAGRFERARIYPIQFTGVGRPTPGGGAVAFVARLASEDFGSSAARIRPSGVPVLSDAPERLGGGQAGGADGGQQPGQGADDDGGGQAAGPGFGRDDDGLAVAAGVDGGGGGADDDADGAAGQGQQDRLGQELGADLAAGGAQGAAQPDLGAAFQDGDDHDVGDPDRADQQRDRAQAEEQGVEGALGVGLGGERVRRLGDVDLVRVFRVGLAPSRLSTLVVAAWVLTVRT